jgi:hypothetical protein
MDLPIRQQGDEVKSGATAKPRAAGKEGSVKVMPDDVEEVILESQDRVPFARDKILFQELHKLRFCRHFGRNRFSGARKPVEGEPFG